MKQETITKLIRKNCKKDCESVIEVFLKMRKSEKEIMLTLEIIAC